MKPRVKSIAEAIMIAFNMVPIPGFCLRGTQNISMRILIKNVAIPIERSVFDEIP